jgi:hypothetical protein
MNLRNIAPVIAALALTVAIPAIACDGNSKTASAEHSCSGMSRNTAWAGAWMQRANGGQLTVIAVAEGSPAPSPACAQGTSCSR